jgi:hypothetical protein
MAESDHRSYRDSAAARAPERPRAQADDPLAELARLIGQSVPMNRLSRDRGPAAPERADDRRGETDHAASYTVPGEVPRAPTDDRHSTREDEQYVRDVDPDYRGSLDERYEPAARENSAPPSRGSRFRQEPDFVMEPAHDAADGEADEAAYQETADWHEQSSDGRDSRYPDEYEDARHDADDHGYGDEYSEGQNTGRRGGFIFVAAVFALAVLGTAGAFGYRAMFGSPALPALPPIIKAEGGPNKIIPSSVGSQDDSARDANANNAASRERLVSREERPVDIPPPVMSTAPRPVSTVPVFPDPPPIGAPGAVLGHSPSPTSSNPATSTEPPALTAAPAMTTTASNTSTAQASPPTAVPSISTATPAAPGPKKIRTVTIHADQSAALDGTAGSSSSQAAAPRPGTQSPQGSNAPLSIVPSSTAEGSAAPARPRPAAPVQPAPLNKPPANETASTGPAAPAATGGGYAVQVSSQRSEEEAQSSFRDLQAKFPDLLGGRTPIIRRADLGAKGIFFRTMVGPFASADQATELCSNLKAAGGNCLVQKN